MNKDAYYFPHFSNARHDRKLKRLRKQFGIEGYGIYFMLLEVLRDQEDFSYPVEDLDLLADEFGTSTEKVQTVVSKYDLFAVTDDQFFFSPNMIEYLRPYLERSQRARDAALKRWSEHKSDANAHANALPEQSAGNASKVKDSKEEKSKVKDIPTLEEFKEHARHACIQANADFEKLKFSIAMKYHTWVDEGWKDGHGKDIKNWKLKFNNTLPHLRPIGLDAFKEQYTELTKVTSG